MTFFTDLGLAEPIVRALDSRGYADPTPIQRQSIPALLEGRDLLGIAQTGAGKTAAFSLPSLHRLASDPKARKPASCRMLVLSPTRELAAQIADNMRGYAKYLSLSIQCVFGGVPVGKNARALVPGCDVLVATPGRLLDLVDQRALTLRDVEVFVLDEADQMMDLGFIVPLKRIAALLPKDRQSLFFSATMPQSIAELGKQFIKNPVRVEVAPQSTTAERVDQYATFLNQAEKQALLTLTLRAGLADQSIDRALVFTRTKHGADRVVRHLATAGIGAAAIHGNKSQAQRTAALQCFRKGQIPVLVATDIAARGIDVAGVSHVFNYEMPNVPEQYVHRIGRTARAGADGIAISYVAPDEKAYLRDIQRLTGVKLGAMPLPEDFTQEAARLPAPAKRKPAEPHGRGGGRGGPRGRTGGRGDERRGPQSERRGGRPQRGQRRQEAPSGYDPIHAERDAERPQRADRARGERPRRDDRPRRDNLRSDFQRGERRRDERPRHDRPFGERPRGERSQGEHRHGDSRRNEHPRSERPRGERPRGERPQGERRHSEKRHGEGRRDERPRNDNPRHDRPRNDRPQGEHRRSGEGRREDGHGKQRRQPGRGPRRNPAAKVTRAG